MAAMQLLTFVHANPSVPPEIKAQAIETANTAIAYAQNYIAGNPPAAATVPKAEAPVVESKPVQEATTPSTPVPYARIKVNGAYEFISVKPDGCITAGIPTCATVDVSWESYGAISPGCGISGAHDWAGNFGTSGSKTDYIHQDTTINIQCNTASGLVSGAVVVNLITTEIESKVRSLKASITACRHNPIPIGAQDAQCAPYEEQLRVLEPLVH